MKISSDTLSILKNFATINSNVLINAGSVIRTLAPTKVIYGSAKIKESFPQDFGIWDLNKFLATVSLFKDPDFVFHEKYVEIKNPSTGASINYFFSDPSMLNPKAPETVKFPEAKVNFEINTKDLSELQKASSVLQVPDMSLVGNSDGIFLKVFDKKDATSNTYQIRVADNTDNLVFSANFKTENLKLIPGHYKVRVSEKNISEFLNTTVDIRYYISLEIDSKWTV